MDQSHKSDCELESRPLPFYWSPLPLQILASKQIAAFLLTQRVHNLDPDAGKIITIDWLFDQRFDFCGLLHVPREIGDAIYSSMRQFCSRIDDWLIYHAFEIFRERKIHDLISKCINFLENDDDKIVARKLFESNTLSLAEQYRLACKYCWRNDIERLWPLASKDPSTAGIYYWNCVMIGIPKDWSDRFEFRLITSTEYLYDWLAVEYFWDKLNAEQRLSIVVDVLERPQDDRILISILPKLNEVELNHVLKEIGGYIFKTLAPFVKYFDYVLRMWKYFCKFASISELDHVLFMVWKNSYESGDMRLTADEGHQISVVLHQLWIHAPIKLRRFFSTTRVEILFDRMDDMSNTSEDEDGGVGKLYGRDMNFMLEILKTQKSATRNGIWRRNWPKFIIRAKPSDLEKLTKVCFENDDDMVRFKEDVMMNYDKLEAIFIEFIAAGHSSKLLDYAEFCSSDQQRVENLKRRILALQFSLIRSNVETFRPSNFDEFLFGTFSNVEFAKQFRAEYVLASENELLPILLINLDQGCLEYAIKICNYLSYELCPSQVKREFLEHCRKYLIECKITKFEITHWREFVASCAGIEENLRAFKESIPVEQVFDKIFDEIVDMLLNPSDGATVMSKCIILDNFLLWYFDNVDIARNYKGTRLNDGRRTRLIHMVFDAGIKTVLETIKWIFDGVEPISTCKIKY